MLRWFNLKWGISCSSLNCSFVHMRPTQFPLCQVAVWICSFGGLKCVWSVFDSRPDGEAERLWTGRARLTERTFRKTSFTPKSKTLPPASAPNRKISPLKQRAVLRIICITAKCHKSRSHHSATVVPLRSAGALKTKAPSLRSASVLWMLTTSSEDWKQRGRESNLFCHSAASVTMTNRLAVK